MKIDLSKCKVGDKVLLRNDMLGTVETPFDILYPLFNVSTDHVSLYYDNKEGRFWSKEESGVYDIVKIIKQQKIPYIWIVEWYDNDDKMWVKSCANFTTRKDAREYASRIFNRSRIRKYVQAD